MPLPLSPRETVAFGYLLQEISMKEIAALMSINEVTLSTFAQKIYKKKNVKSRIGLIIQFYQAQQVGREA